jgi:hypothetical protein
MMPEEPPAGSESNLLPQLIVENGSGSKYRQKTKKQAENLCGLRCGLEIGSRTVKQSVLKRNAKPKKSLLFKQRRLNRSA